LPLPGVSLAAPLKQYFARDGAALLRRFCTGGWLCHTVNNVKKESGK
jgi:hypothetical protein